MKKLTHFSLRLTNITCSMAAFFMLYSCANDPVAPDRKGDVAIRQQQLEFIMDGESAWKIGRMESDVPRAIAEESSLDWLSQMPACNNDDPIRLQYRGMTNVHGQVAPDLIYIEVDSGQGEKCTPFEIEATLHGAGKSLEKFDKYQVEFSSAHRRFYGYTLDTSDPDYLEQLREVWTDFQASEDSISFEVDKTYEGHMYHLGVKLVPFE